MRPLTGETDLALSLLRQEDDYRNYDGQYDTCHKQNFFHNTSVF